MTVINFPTKRSSEPRKLESFADLTPTDAALDDRAAALIPAAQETIARFPPDAIAEMLAYAAARLERVGFRML
jgi:hypothetical protein